MDIQIELEQKVERYKSLTAKALQKVAISAAKGTKEHDIAKDYLKMAQNYYDDACHFQEKGDLLTSLASFSYAHAWLDAGVRAAILDAKGDSRLFTTP